LKLDKHNSHIKVCPKTKEEMSFDDIMYNNGVCPKCGHRSSFFLSHWQFYVGTFNRPSFFERVFQGKKIEFIPKELGQISC